MESKFQDLIIRRFNNEFHHLIPHLNTFVHMDCTITSIEITN